MLQSKVIRSQGAFTLVESMIATAVLTVVVLAVTIMIKNTQDSVSLGEVGSARDQIANQIEKAMQDFTNVELSAARGTAAGNRMLANCLDNGAGTCTATNPRAQESFQFMIPAPGGRVRTLGGTTQNPVDYDRNGVPDCATAKAAVDCPLWQVRAYFYATCPPTPPSSAPATRCSQATTIHVRYQVAPTRARLARGDKDPLADRELKARPPEPEFSRDPESYAISHKVGTSLTTDSCPANSEQVGWDGSGKISCKCRFGITQSGIDANGFPICPTNDMICNPSELLQGVDLNGKPICTRVRQRCDWITFANNSEQARCPNAGWLEAIDLGRCTAARRSKKGRDRKITCAQNRGYCCFYEPIR